MSDLERDPHESPGADPALVTVEVCGRLAVHAAVALELGQNEQVLSLLTRIATTATDTVDAAGEQAPLVRAEARKTVNPVVGWASPAA